MFNSMQLNIRSGRGGGVVPVTSILSIKMFTALQTVR